MADPQQNIATDTSGNQFDRATGQQIGTVDLSKTNPYGGVGYSEINPGSYATPNVQTTQPSYDFASSLSENDIKAQEQAQADKMKASITGQYEPKIAEATTLGENQLGGAKAQFGLYGGRGASSANIQFLDQMQKDNQKFVNNLTKERDTAINSADYNAVEKANARIDQLKATQFEIFQKQQDAKLKANEAARPFVVGGITYTQDQNGVLKALPNQTTNTLSLKDYADIALKLPVGQTLQYGGSKITGLKQDSPDVINNRVETPNGQGGVDVYNVAIDKNTGKVLYKTNLGQEAGKAAGGNELPVETSKVLDSNSGSILAQTGLSVIGFNFLTQGTTALTRMNTQQRTQVMNEAQKFLDKNGIDISTFQSQYKSYNDVLSANIQRMNRTKIMENEITGTLSNLGTVATDAELGKLNFANMAKIWAGKNINDPVAQKYAFHFQQLKNELAGYFAASQGKTAPDLVDNNDASNAIKNGINKGSMVALQQAVDASTKKMAGVLQNSVDSSRKAVWDLFGVGNKFKSGQQAETKIINGATYEKADGGWKLKK